MLWNRQVINHRFKNIMENNPGIYLSKVMFKAFEKQVKEHPLIATVIFLGVTIGVPVATYYFKRRCDKDFERTKHEHRMEEIKAKREQKENNKGKEQESVSETSVNSLSKSIKLSEVDLKKYDGHYDDDQLIGKLISVEDTVVIYGDTGIGKSTFTYQLAVSIVRGESCSVIPEQYKTTKEILRQQVLYYDFEHKLRDLYRIFGDEDLSECHCFELVNTKDIKDLSDWIIDVKNRLTEIKNDVVIFLDNFSCINLNADTNTVKDFFREQLVSVHKEGEARGQRITFIIVFHPNKKGELFGSVNFRNLSSNVLILKKSDTDSNKLILKVEKNRQYGDMTGKEFLEEKVCSESGWKHFVGEEICDEAVVETKEEAKEEAKAGRVRRPAFDFQFLGRVTVRGLPSPSVLSTLASPPWKWAISLTIERPRPLLPFSEREGSACQKRCHTFGIFSGAIPIPSSETESVTKSAPSLSVSLMCPLSRPYLYAF